MKVLGLGNPTRGDDAAGARVVRLLQGLGIEAGVLELRCRGPVEGARPGLRRHRRRAWGCRGRELSFWASRLLSVQGEFEEMGGAGNAGIIVANGLLAFPGGFVDGPCGQLCSVLPQIVFDAALVLGGRRDDPGGEDPPAFIERIPVIEDAARGLGDGVAYTGPLGCRGTGEPGWLIFAEEAQRFGASEDQLNGADRDAAKRVPQGRGQANPAGRVLRDGGEPVKVEIESGERAHEIRSPPAYG